MTAPDTQRIMDLVKEKTGHSVSVSVDDKIATHASMVSASSSMPMHLVKVHPKFGKYGDYLVAMQCAMLLIKWADPERIPDFVVLNNKAGHLEDKLAKQVSDKGMPTETARQYAKTLVIGMLQQLNSIPIQIIAMDMISELCPGLRILQEESVRNELREASGIFTPQIKELTPQEVFDRSAVLNATYAIKWSRVSGDTTGLIPYRSLGYLRRGERLLEMYETISRKQDPDRYVETVDAWAEDLKMTFLYVWHFRRADR